ncbi:MAG: hypothetical protein WC054_05510 [Candidatus Nanopelagicales bacterium]
MSSQERALRVAQQQIGNQRMMKAMLDSELVALRAENERLKAIVDAIPGDDKLGWVRNAINDQADAQMVYGAVAEVYCNLTRGRLSKPNTAPAAIIAEVEQFINEDIAEALKEAAEEADEDLRALCDAIPGDDKLAVVRYCVEFTRADHHCFDAGSTGNEWLKWDAKRAALWGSCPPSVRAALATGTVAHDGAVRSDAPSLRSNGGES